MWTFFFLLPFSVYLIKVLYRMLIMWQNHTLYSPGEYLIIATSIIAFWFIYKMKIVFCLYDITLIVAFIAKHKSISPTWFDLLNHICSYFVILISEVWIDCISPWCSWRSCTLWAECDLWTLPPWASLWTYLLRASECFLHSALLYWWTIRDEVGCMVSFVANVTQLLNSEFLAVDFC